MVLPTEEFRLTNVERWHVVLPKVRNKTRTAALTILLGVPAKARKERISKAFKLERKKENYLYLQITCRKSQRIHQKSRRANKGIPQVCRAQINTQEMIFLG